MSIQCYLLGFRTLYIYGLKEFVHHELYMCCACLICLYFSVVIMCVCVIQDECGGPQRYVKAVLTMLFTVCTAASNDTGDDDRKMAIAVKCFLLAHYPELGRELLIMF